MKELIAPELIEMAINANNRHLKIRSIYDEIYLLRAFINEQEQQIDRYIKNINTRIEPLETGKIISYGYDSYDLVQVDVLHIQGVSDDDYDIIGLFTESFPLYQRQSMLTTLWSMLEDKLGYIYKMLSMESNKALKRKPNGCSQFQFLISELGELGASFKEKKIEETISFLDQKIRPIRNDWVHHGGVPQQDYSTLIEEDKIKITEGKIEISNKFLNEIIDKALMVSSHIVKELDH